VSSVLLNTWGLAEHCSITKIALVAGGKDVLVYTTISGAVGALIPFSSMDDVEVMTTLEMVRLCLVVMKHS
jgi:hypothetical protein